MYSIFTVGVALWLSYGILVNDLPMLLANSITLVLALLVLGLTIIKRVKNNKNASNTSTEQSTQTENIVVEAV
jgi:MtN3 and saliva related transmembrane protein